MSTAGLRSRAAAACIPDGFHAPLADTNNMPFAFDRLGVRVPSILVSPWIAKGTVGQPGRSGKRARVRARFHSRDHYAALHRQLRQPTPREKAAQTFLDLLTDEMRPDSDCPTIEFE